VLHAHASYLTTSYTSAMRTPDRLCVAWVLLCVGWPSVCADHTVDPDDGIFGDMTCEQCATNQYCLAGASFSCPTDSTNEFRQGTIEGCVCDPGFLKVSSVSAHTCTQGLKPHYYSGGIQNICPDHKQTISNGASLVNECVCEPGYQTTLLGTCTECSIDTYQDEFDKFSCK